MQLLNWTQFNIKALVNFCPFIFRFAPYLKFRKNTYTTISRRIFHFEPYHHLSIYYYFFNPVFFMEVIIFHSIKLMTRHGLIIDIASYQCIACKSL